MQDLISFKKFITPGFMQVIFWILVAANTISAIILMFSAGSPYVGGGAVVLGLLQLILGPIFIRVACEVTIVIFRIYETLDEMRKRGSM